MRSLARPVHPAHRRLLSPALLAAASLATAPTALANPQLPVIPSTIFSILDYGGSTSSADNSGAILGAIGAAHAAGGGTVVIPSGTFAANPFTITTSTINLQIDYLAGSPLGSWGQGEAHLLRATRSLVFMQGLVRADDVVAARVSGIFKIGALFGDDVSRAMAPTTASTHTR